MAKLKSKNKKLILLDAHAIIHRAYHALPDFTSSSGEPTGALYGLSLMLLKIINELKPDYIVACYDLPEPTYRHKVYKDYKGGRKKTDDALVSQLNSSRNVFSAFDISIYEKAGFEADDILGTIAEQMKSKKGIEIIIASGDMDTLQLVDKKKVQVYTLRKGIQDTILYDEKAVEDRFGFKPKLLPDYKGLRGDPSDNIIGIAGVGEKTATTLIKAFGSIENMYKELKISDLKFKKAGLTPRIINLLKDNEEEALFSKMLAEIKLDVPIKFKLQEEVFNKTLNIEKVLDLFSELSFRTLSRRVEDMFGVVTKEEEKDKEEISEEEFKKIALSLWVLNSSLTNPDKEDILQFTKTKNLKEAKQKILKNLKKDNLLKIFEEIELPLIQITDKMHDRGVKLNIEYLKKLSKEYHKNLEKLRKSIYKYAGDEFNINSPRQLSEVLFDKLEISSKNIKKTSTGQRSTRESELEKLKDEHKIIKEILLYRELQKLLSTYIDNFITMVDKDNRLHATFLQSGTTTGRMSSQNPNLQNIPIHSELGKRIRNAFIATEGFEFVAVDYSQIELRVASFMSEDKKLISIFKEGGDVHSAVASEVFNVKPDKVDSEMRRIAKVINFGILYGMGVNSLRQNLGTSRKEAQEFYNEYFRKFKGLANYIDETKKSVAKKGFTETHFGRRRYFEGINSSLPFIRAQAERMAINAPIQGTQADIIKIAMDRIDSFIKESGLEKDVFLLLQVHDELIFEIKKSKVKDVTEKIKNIMEGVMTTKETNGVPLLAVASKGGNWGELKKI